jgi:Polysaccharide biosynthesis enzyme WcbI
MLSSSIPLDKKLKCVFYGNCQCLLIWSILRLVPMFLEQYEDKFNCLSNYHLIANQTPLDLALLKDADLFIYQPIDSKHGQYATNKETGVLSHLKASCRMISFPYIYQSALWPLIKPALADDLVAEYGNFNKYINREVILDLKKQGHNLQEILNMWDQNKIDFNYAARYKASLQILRNKEAITDLKVSDFISQHIRTHRMFLTQNHPTSPIMVHCTKQLLKLLGIEEQLNLFALKDDFGYEKSQKSWPVSKYDLNYWKWSYPVKESANADKFYKDIITSIYEL